MKSFMPVQLLIAMLLPQGDIAVRDGKVDRAFSLYLDAEPLGQADDRARRSLRSRW